MKQFIKSPKNIEDLYSLVELECKLIKEHFTSEEINKLKLDIIDPTDPNTCIYGCMVGDCNSHRVNEFINNNLKILIQNETPKNLKYFEEEERSGFYMTPMEEYIYEKKEERGFEHNLILQEETKERIQKVINLLKN